VVCVGPERHPVAVTADGAGYRVAQDGAIQQVAIAWQPGDPVSVATVDGRTLTVQISRHGTSFSLTHGGSTMAVRVLAPRIADLLDLMPLKQPPDLSRFLLSPMPGLLVSLAVREGQEVKSGEALATVEAMKMENVLRAERDGTVAAIRAKVGASLAVDEVILEFA
jgi:propionyl-CoA carboxylase alpha chain